ncbi:MAG: AMP-binding protein [Candidatus Omnitrophica bacterium]|nr:AMP-binding protein [Candidatus Omnitrophota bacterium]
MNRPPQGIFEAFLSVVEKYPARPALFYQAGDTFAAVTYQEVIEHAKRHASLLKEKGVGRGTHVGIVLENSPSWLFAYLGIQCLGAVAVPLDFQLAGGFLAQFLAHAEATCLITSRALFKNIKYHIDGLPGLTVVQIDTDETQAALEKKTPDTLSPEPEKIASSAVASIVYTSGTTSVAKGVMLSHDNILSNVASIHALGIAREDDIFSCLLPLHHTYPFTVSLMTPLFLGAAVSFPADLGGESLKKCLHESKVTILVGVPLLFNRIKKGIEKKIAEKPLSGRLAFALASRMPPALRRRLFRPVCAALGPCLRILVSGGAALDKKCALFFERLTFTLLEGYGLTETAPVLTFNTPGRSKIGSVGRALPDVEVCIDSSDDEGFGEVVVRGPNIMKGYYKQTDLTGEVLRDGWFHTKDVGRLDKDGHLFLKGRESELIVLESGKNINPEELEKHYEQSPYIREICVTAVYSDEDRKEKLVGIIVPNEEEFEKKDKFNVRQSIKWEIDNLSQKLPPPQRLKGFVLTTRQLPRTRLGKLIRYPIRSLYEDDLAGFREEEALSEDDQRLLASDVSQGIIDFLAKEFKKEVSLNDYFELDLGLDSLDMIELLIKLEKFLGIHLAEEEGLELAGARTVKDLILRAKKMMPETEVASLMKEFDFSWGATVQVKPKEKSLREISITPSLFERCVRAMAYYIFKGIFRVFFRLSVRGAEHLPKEGPVLLCPNHVSYLDGFALVSALPLSLTSETYFVGMRVLLDMALIRPFQKIGHLIRIDPVRDLVETLRICTFLIDQKKVIAFFPEGQRSPDGRLQRFRKGAGILIQESSVPVIPVFIEGTYQAWPSFRKLPRLARLGVTFGKILSAGDLAAGGDTKEDIYQNISDRLRGEVEKLRQNDIASPKPHSV